MARRYWIQTSDNKITGFSDIDAVAVPDDHTAVLETVIRAVDPPGADGRIQAGGTWDGSAYTAPIGGGVITIDTGIVTVAARNALDVLDSGVSLILDNASTWPFKSVVSALTAIHYQKVNMARICLNATRTEANRQKFCEEVGSWPADSNGDVATFVDGVAAIDASDKYSFVDPTGDPPARVDAAAGVGKFDSPANVEAAPSTAKLISRSWLGDIP